MSKVCLLIGGAWSGASLWQPFSLSLLSKGVVSFSFDHKGAGVLAPPCNTALGSESLEPGMSIVAGISFQSRLAEYMKVVDDLYYAVGGKITIIAHSLGGIILSQLLATHANKIDGMIYVSGYMLKDGNSASNLLAQPCMKNCRVGELITEPFDHLKATRIHLSPADKGYLNRFGDILYGDLNDTELHAVLRNCHSDEPLSLFNFKLEFDAVAFEAIPRHYIVTTQDQAIPVEAQEFMINEIDKHYLGKTNILRIESGHSPMMTHPEKLSSLVVSCIGN